MIYLMWEVSMSRLFLPSLKKDRFLRRMQKHFKAIGISYKNTSLEVRESVAFDETQTKQFLGSVRELTGIEEALLVSTCNRTELYYYANKDWNRELARLIDVFHSNDAQLFSKHCVIYNHDEALNQLFKVSLGLESMVLGDIQISNQIKKSYQWTADEQMAGPFLHRLLHTIFYTNKRAVQETSIHDGTASVASAAVDLANKFMMNYVSPKVLVVGLGEIGQNVAENLKGTSAQVTLVNRSFEKTQKLADELSFESRRFEDLNALINDAHIVISAVQAETPVITSEMIRESGVPRLFIDLSVPRSIDNSLETLPGVLLYNVDQLEEKTASALLKRDAAVTEVQMILEKSIEEFNNWAQEMEVSPAIKKFKNALEEIRKEELSRYLEKADAEQIKLLEDATKSMMQRVIKLPVLQLKAACKRGEADQLVGLLNDLFNLEKEETKSSK